MSRREKALAARKRLDYFRNMPADPQDELLTARLFGALSDHCTERGGIKAFAAKINRLPVEVSVWLSGRRKPNCGATLRILASLPADVRASIFQSDPTVPAQSET